MYIVQQHFQHYIGSIILLLQSFFMLNRYGAQDYLLWLIG